MTIAGMISIVPERLAVLCIVDAALEMERALNDPIRWFFVIPKLHRGLNCALVAALRGTAGVGAYSEADRRAWLEYLNDMESKQRPGRDHVQPFAVLLRRACDPSEPEMHGEPLRNSAEQKRDLERLDEFRGNIEHEKLRHWILDPLGLPRIAGVAGLAFQQLFEKGIGLHLDDDERETAVAAIRRTEAIALRYRSHPPGSAAAADEA